MPFELRDPSFHKSNFPHLRKRTVNADEGDLEEEPNPMVKFMTMFERRAAKGQCVNQPYLGCREFAAEFKLVEPGDVQPAADPRDPRSGLHALRPGL